MNLEPNEFNQSDEIGFDQMQLKLNNIISDENQNQENDFIFEGNQEYLREATTIYKKEKKKKRAQKTKLALNIKEKTIYQKFIAFIFTCLYGNDYNDFNTVTESILGKNYFWILQLIRLFSLLSLASLLLIYLYIYVKQSVFLYNFYALVLATFAFAFLFVGAGQQMVYQKILQLPYKKETADTKEAAKKGIQEQDFQNITSEGQQKLTLASKKSSYGAIEQNQKIDTQHYCHFKFENLKYRRDNWVLGHFFYVQAVPVTFISILIYFVNFSGLSSIRDDTNLLIQTKFDKKFEDGSFRQMSVMAGTIAPGVCLMIDFILNKIRIPFRQVLINLLISVIYILITFIGQIYYQYPIYANNIAWNFELDSSIAVLFNNTQNVTEGQIFKNCQENKDTTQTILNASFYSKFKIPGISYNACDKYKLPSQESLQLYDQFKNCYLIISIILLGSFVSFIFSYILHKLKSSGSKPYKGPTKK